MKIVVSGGGTGGHIYPALAFINEMKKRDERLDVLYIGTERGLESEIVPREGIPFQTIHITGFQRKLSMENAKTVVRFLRGTKRAKALLNEFKPDVVIGTGGYVCGPVVYAAAKLKIPTVIHEQNSVPGLTNKFLSRYVDRIAICFKEAEAFFPKNKVVFTGNPRASEVMSGNREEGLRSLSIKPNKKTVLIVGGSRGARPINDAFMSILSDVKAKPYQFVYVTGTVHYERVQEQMKSIGQPENVIVQPFIHNMPDVLSAVDLIVARAGATTLAEITALGLPSILIPSPYVTNNHQEKNAAALSKKDAAILRKESELTGDRLLQDIDDIMVTPGRLDAMKQAAKALGVPTAAEKLHMLVKEVAK
ncbi:undecaprenyldiphospho-muramoylpentapeptide beta-N-acetylglucosaminyltransferase [Halalkalibacterium halodurans]|uniref:undecaprenyldiphospho-muramoylpentapeptide beta-N-acetylglucosaminyltransferase n=1 Tax=Halalkalibacterium halodurans TaxID=86665 RepID=UPI002AAA4A12|nr:undecaprenyldiphospho-muramoylpentapeptide beta-N-acetylglucosaminyltransferase [Halalkalibacterium halodurans]MDY7223102.1 undecaprenyldiphospho-muramoylpentapeptide beta-N-acetylglucosaminyltransferase [Halalkalibacterium halodurans]MDY7242323.1 undecaprenyldiphospho-muramoylpentapeptide beta-N-acetylglucosaminyltransferase [Halalkalibacterium halodurans]